MADNIKGICILDLLPSNLRADENIRSAAQALDAELRAVTSAIDECLHLPRLDELSEEVVDLLAWQWHVDFYEPGLSLEKKREMVRKSIAWHRKKGTPAVVQDVVSTIFSSGNSKEWFEYGGQPFHFRVETTGIVSDETAYIRLFRLVNAVKNTRSWLESIMVKRTWGKRLNLGIVMQAGRKTTILPITFHQEDVSGNITFGTAVHSGKQITIKEVAHGL